MSVVPSDYGLHSQDIEPGIAKLESEAFEVPGPLVVTRGSMLDLARWVKKSSLRNWSYAEFNDELKKIPTSTDFLLLAKSAMERRQQASVASAASKRAYNKVDYDSEIEILEEMCSRENPTGRRSLLNDLKLAAKPSPANRKPSAFRRISQTCPKKNKLKKNVDYGLPKSGIKPNLIPRLQGPRPPRLLVRRKQYVRWCFRSLACSTQSSQEGCRNRNRKQRIGQGWAHCQGRCTKIRRQS